MVDFEVELTLRVRQLRVDVLQRRMLFAVPLRQLDLLVLKLEQLALEALDLRVLRDQRDRVHRDRVQPDGGHERLDLAVLRLLLHARHLRLGDGVVQLVQPREHDVLLVVERQGVLLVAILRERPLAFLDLRLLVGELLFEPGQHVLAGLELDLQVLVDVLLHQRVGGLRRELRIDRIKRHVHQPAAAHRVHAHAADERADQRRFVGRCDGLRRLGRRRLLAPEQREEALPEIFRQRHRRRRRRQRAVELRHLAEVQLGDHALREVAALENLVLRLVVGLGIFVELLGASDAGNGRRALVLDQQTSLGAEVLDARIPLNHHRGRRQHEDGDRDPPVAVEHRDAVEQVDVGVRRKACAGAGPPGGRQLAACVVAVPSGSRRPLIAVPEAPGWLRARLRRWSPARRRRRPRT